MSSCSRLVARYVTRTAAVFLSHIRNFCWAPVIIGTSPKEAILSEDVNRLPCWCQRSSSASASCGCMCPDCEPCRWEEARWSQRARPVTVLEDLCNPCRSSTSCTPTDLGVHGTWKSVLLSPNRGCENTFCCLTPVLLAVLHVLLPLLPSFTQHFVSSEGRVQKMKCRVFFPPSRTNWAKKSK